MPGKVPGLHFCVPSEHHKSLVEFHGNNILTEMKERAPDVLDFMVAMAVPQLKGSDGRQIRHFA